MSDARSGRIAMFEHSHDYEAFYVDTEQGSLDEIREGVQWLRNFPSTDDGLLLVPSPDHLTRDAVVEVLPNLRPGRQIRVGERRITPMARMGSFPEGKRGPVLALWPDDFLGDVHELFGMTALCVVPRFRAKVQSWILGMGAKDVRTGFAPASTPLDPVVEQAMLGLMIFANPRNRLIQAEDKAAAINALETLRDDGFELDPQALESWAIGYGRPLDEAAHVAEYVNGVNEGKRYRIARWSRRTAAQVLGGWKAEADAP